MPFVENIDAFDIQKGHHRDPGPNSVLIQIMDPDMEFPTPKHAFAEVLKFKFLDLSDGDQGVEKLGISKSQARLIAQILEYAHGNDSNVIVHCFGGVSRSGAVVEAAVEMGFEDAKRYRCPNLRVKHFLFEELGLEFDPNEKNYSKHVCLDEDGDVVYASPYGG